ncbi:MAG: hypothetical protein LC121_13200 [Anaerolineae bacterium]|nr:hypothetical protein [Anaerolineae bacterium]
MTGPETNWNAATLEGVDAFVFRAHCEVPVRTSFGVMHDRPAVLVRVRDSDGAQGWGEIWCNFPGVGADHRAALVRTVIAPLLTGAVLEFPSALSGSLQRRLEVLAIQSGEFGPIAQTLAGIDQALWDLAARRLGLPLWRLLVGCAVSPVTLAWLGRQRRVSWQGLLSRRTVLRVGHCGPR